MKILLKMLAIAGFLTGCSSKPELPIAQYKNSAENKVSFVADNGSSVKTGADKTNPPEITPFLTAEEEKEFGERMGKVINYLNLSAIFYSPGHSYAIINGNIVKKEDTVNNKKVVKINSESVILEDATGARYIVEMKRP